MTNAIDDRTANDSGQITPVVPVTRRETYTPLSPLDELYFADWPHRTDANQNMHKYDLRHWLVGYAIMHGWTYSEKKDFCDFSLRRNGAIVDVLVVQGGLKLSDGTKDRFIKSVY